MDASLKVFSEKGFDRASIEDIAKEAGYTKGAFYVHFSSKEELLLKLMENRLEKYKEQLSQILTIIQNGQEDYKKAVEQGIDLFIELTKNDHWAPIYFEICANALRNEEIKKRLSSHIREWIRLIVQGLKQYKHFADKDFDDLSRMASTIIIILDGYHLQNSIAGDDIKKEWLKQIIVQLLEMDPLS